MAKITESSIQTNFISWTEWQGNLWPGLKLIHSNPLGGNRDLVTGAKLKAEGAKAGIPDLFLPYGHRGKHGLYIEFKLPFKKPRPVQVAWINKLRDQDFAVHVCWGYEDAVAVTSWYLGYHAPAQLKFAWETMDDKYKQLVLMEYRENIYLFQDLMQQVPFGSDSFLQAYEDLVS